MVNFGATFNLLLKVYYSYDLFLPNYFDDPINPYPTNGKSIPTMLLLNLPGGAMAPPCTLSKNAYGWIKVKWMNLLLV